MRRRLKPSSRSSFKRSQPHPLISNIRPVRGGLGLLGREKPLLVLGALIEPPKRFRVSLRQTQYYK